MANIFYQKHADQLDEFFFPQENKIFLTFFSNFIVIFLVNL